MKSYTLEDFGAALSKIGVVPGDAVMVHSALFALGRLEGVAFGAIAAVLADRLREYLGPEGTLVVPIYSYEGIEFFKDYRQRQMGPLSSYVAALPEARRTYHPTFGLAAVGEMADSVAAADSLSATSSGGPFEFLLASGAKVLLLGTNKFAASVLHVAEDRVRVPYRYWMEFPGERISPDGSSERVSYRMFVRDLKKYPNLNEELVEEWLMEDGVLHTASIGGGLLKACTIADYVGGVERRLREDPLALIPK